MLRLRKVSEEIFSVKVKVKSRINNLDFLFNCLGRVCLAKGEKR